jgi:hypothetical protein
LLRLVLGSRAPSKRPQLIEIPVTARVADNAVQAGVSLTAAEESRLTPVAWYARGLVASSGLKYVEYPQTGQAELYDLTSDPFELDNLANDPTWAAKVAKMSTRLHKWWHCHRAACR